MQLCQLCTQYAWPCWVRVWSHWRSVDQMGPSKTTPNPQWFDRLKPSKTHHFQQHFEMPNWSTIKVTFVKPSSETSGNCSILNGYYGYYGYYHSIEAPFSAALPLVTGCQPGWISSPWPQWRLHTCRTWDTWDLTPGQVWSPQDFRPSAKCRKVARA